MPAGGSPGEGTDHLGGPGADRTLLHAIVPAFEGVEVFARVGGHVDGSVELSVAEPKLPMTDTNSPQRAAPHSVKAGQSLATGTPATFLRKTLHVEQ
jgi:hypothetical protein